MLLMHVKLGIRKSGLIKSNGISVQKGVENECESELHFDGVVECGAS